MSNCQYAIQITAGVVVTVLIGFFSVVHAETRISGQVSHSGRPASSAELSFVCNETLKTAVANNYGAFQVFIPSGKSSCNLTVKWDNRNSEKVPIQVNGQKVLSINLKKWGDEWLLEIR